MAGRELDLVLRDCRVVDGCGNPWYRADLGVRSGRVARIAPPGALKAGRVLEIDGRYAAPGFIDPHTHSDLSILTYPRADSALRQGVTTHVIGNCGMSAAPVVGSRLDDLLQLWGFYGFVDEGIGWAWRSFAQYLREVQAVQPSINVAALVGHGALRVAAMGFAPRAASAREQALMERLLARSLASGAFGLSSGLVYPPGCYADTAELIALARVAARYSGIYTTHVRGERETIIEAVEEAILIGREGGLPVEVSHNAPKWGAADDASANLALMEAARVRGQDVTTDNDSHTDLAPRLSRALPQPVLDLGPEELMLLLRDPGRRAALKRDVEEDRLPGAGYAGLLRHHAFDRIVVFFAPSQPAFTGRSIASIAAERGADPFDTFLDLILEEDDRVVGIFDYIEQDNIRALLTHRLSMCCSDGLVMPPVEQLDRSLYWPCSYGEYPGILERYVRDEPLLSLEDAVRRMTSFPAQRFGLHDRGVLRPGLAADVVVFDLDRIRDRATNPFPHGAPLVNVPHGYPEGIDYVLVNGRVVIEDGAHTGAAPGLVLRHRSG